MPQADLTELRIDRSAARTPRRRRIPRWLIVAAVSAVAAAFVLQRWLGAPIAVDTVVVSASYPYQALTVINAAGYVVAQRKAAVASKATGRLEWLGVAEGARVSRGELIARLENRDVRAQVDQAAAAVGVARAGVLQAEAERNDARAALNRARDLVAKRFVAESALDASSARFDKAAAGLVAAQANVRAAQAAARAAQVAYDQTLIRAPFDGVVLTKNANVGDVVTPFSSALDTKGAVVTMADMSTLEVEADVSESNLQAIHVGQSCEIQLDAFPDLRLRGEVARLVPTVDRAKATVMTKLRFIDRDPRILPEMSAKVAFLSRAIDEGERAARTVVSPDAVVERAGKKLVFELADGKARAIEVGVGAPLGDAVTVSGVAVGTRVVLRPDPRIADGAALQQIAK